MRDEPIRGGCALHSILAQHGRKDVARAHAERLIDDEAGNVSEHRHRDLRREVIFLAVSGKLNGNRLDHCLGQ